MVLEVFIELFNFSGFCVWGIDLDYYDVEWFVLETNWDHSVIFEIAPKYCILDSCVDSEGYSISCKGFWATCVAIMVIWIKFAHSERNVNVLSCHLLFDHFQLTVIHRPNVPGSCAVLFFTTWDFTFTIRRIHNLALFLLWPSLIILSGVMLSSPVAYWTPTDLEAHLLVWYLFSFSCCSWGSQGKNTEVVCLSLLQWTMFCLTQVYDACDHFG